MDTKNGAHDKCMQMSLGQSITGRMSQTLTEPKTIENYRICMYHGYTLRNFDPEFLKNASDTNTKEYGINRCSFPIIFSPIFIAYMDREKSRLFPKNSG
jgi:hypothetical protein